MFCLLNLVGLTTIILVTFLVTFSHGQSCAQRVTSHDVYECRISSQNDFNTIPLNATILYLTFTQEFGASFVTEAHGSLNLSHLVKLRELNLDLRYFPRLWNGTFAGLPLVERLVLYHTSSSPEYRLILDVGSFVGLAGLTELYASNLGISSLPPKVFAGLNNLEYLDMHLNHIEYIDNVVFTNCCQNLFSVNFARNRLSGVSGIRTLSNLRILDLHGNNVTRLPDAAFKGLNNLEDMNLASNDIGEIANRAFIGLYKLKKLYLDRNKIVEITADTFSGLSNLAEIDLQDNALRVMRTERFSSLKALTKLILSNNQISEIETCAMCGLGHLLTLKMDNNVITSLYSDIFVDVPNLERLDLMLNQISSFAVNTFRRSFALRDVNLGSNLLTSLPEGVFDSLSSLSTLDVSNNPWTCDCQLYWLAVIVSDRKICNVSISITDFDETTCRLPESSRGASIAGAFSNMNCTTPMTKCPGVITESSPRQKTTEENDASPRTSSRAISPSSTTVSSVLPSVSTEPRKQTSGVVDSTVTSPTSNNQLKTTTILAHLTVHLPTSKKQNQLKTTTSLINPASGNRTSWELMLGHRAGIIIAACIFAVLIVGLSGFITQRVLRRYSWWRISHDRDTADGKRQREEVTVMGGVERGGYDNSGILYECSENGHAC